MRFHAKVSRYVKKSGLLRESLGYFALFNTKIVLFFATFRVMKRFICIMPKVTENVLFSENFYFSRKSYVLRKYSLFAKF